MFIIWSLWWTLSIIKGYPAYYLSILWIVLIVLTGALASLPLIAFGKPKKLSQNEKHHNSANTIIGIRGFLHLEECDIGAHHSLDTFNLLSGAYFITVLLTVVPVLYFAIKHEFGGHMQSNLTSVIRNLIFFLFMVSIIVGICDIVYSFYIASQVFGQFREFQQGLVKCSSLVYYSSSVSVVIVFNYIFVEICLVAEISNINNMYQYITS